MQLNKSPSNNLIFGELRDPEDHADHDELSLEQILDLRHDSYHYNLYDSYTIQLNPQSYEQDSSHDIDMEYDHPLMPLVNELPMPRPQQINDSYSNYLKVLEKSKDNRRFRT